MTACRATASHRILMPDFMMSKPWRRSLGTRLNARPQRSGSGRQCGSPAVLRRRSQLPPATSGCGCWRRWGGKKVQVNPGFVLPPTPVSHGCNSAASMEQPRVGC